MATIKQINEIDNIIHVTDQTADGTESATRNMDALQDKADAVGGSMAEMGASGGKATRALAEGVGEASDAFNGLSTTAASRVNQLGKELDQLTEKRSQLLDVTRNAGGSGLGTEDTATDLENINTEISRVTAQMDRAQRQAHVAADAQAAWNGELTEGRSVMVSVGDTISQVTEAQNAAVNSLKAGIDGSQTSFLRMAAAAGDKVSKLTLQLQTAQDRLQQMQVQAKMAVANGLDENDASYGVAAQQARVDALQQQITLEKEARAAADELTTALDEQTLVQSKNTNATKLEGYQVGILMDEAHKFFDQIMAGGNPLQAAFYQVPNAVQIMGGLGNSLQLVRGLLVGPAGIALAAGAAGAAIYKLGAYAESEQQQLTQLSTHLRATRTDYADMATAAEKAARSLHESDSDLSLSDSRTAVQTIVSVPTVDSSQIERYMTDARNLAAVMGQTVPEAAKTMASALQDPAKAAEEFAQQGMPGFDAGLVLMVQNMEQAGDRTGALDTVLKHLELTTKNAEDQALTPFGQALKNLKDEAGPLGDALVYSAKHAGDGIVGMATSGINAIANLITQIKKVPGEIAALGSSALSSAGSFGKWVYGGLEKAVESMVPSGLAHLMQQGSTPDPQFSMPHNANAMGGASAGWGGAATQTNAQSAKAAADMLATVASEQHLNADEAYLMRLIQPQESSAGQYKDGGLVTSKAGAIGAMQVKPENSSGYDLTDLHGNESAGAKLLKSYYEKYDGDLTLTAMAYNWGPGNVDKWLTKGSDPDAIPQETQDYIAKTTEGAVYGPTTLAGYRQQADTYVSKGDAGVSGQMSDLQRTLSGQVSALDSVNKSYQAGGISAEQYAADVKILSDQIDATKASIANLRDPTQELAHSQDLAAQSAAGLTGYDRQMISVAQQVDQAQLSLNGTHASAAQVLTAQAQAQRILDAQWQAGTAAVTAQAEGVEKATRAYEAGNMTSDQATAYAQAYTEAQDSFAKGSPAFVQAVKTRTDEMVKASNATKALQLAQQNSQLEDNLTYIQAETASLGQNADQRQVNLAVLQKDLDLHRQYGDIIPDEALKNRDLTESIAQATVELQHHQEVLNEVTGAISNMSDQLFDGVTQGFLQGTASGMSFKSTLQGLETQALSMVSKFALINPLLNSIDGGTRATLSDINGLFSSANNGTGGYLSGLSIQQQQNVRNEAAQYQTDWAPTGTGITASGKKTLTQELLSTQLFGSKNSSGDGTIGSLLGGVGAGLSIGALTSKIGHGTDGGIGSLIGSGVGAIVGSFVPVIGTVLGGLIGGAGGGLLGSLFGGKHHYTIDDVSGLNGLLSITNVHNHRNTDSITSGLQDDLDTINQTLSMTGASVDDGLAGQVYAKRYRGKKSNQTLEDILPDIKLNTDDATFNMALQQLMPSSFSSVSEYTQDIQSLKELSDTLDSMGVAVSKFDDSSHITVDHFNGYTGDMATALSTLDGQTLSTDDLQTKFDAIKDFVGTTMPGLLDVTAAGSESLMQQVDDLKDKYQDAANTAASYGLDAQNLLDKGNAIAAMMIDNERTTLAQADQSVQARYMAATGDQEGADLLNQQVSAAQEVQQLQDNWRGFLGDSFAANQTYQDQLADLEKTQAAERLQIQQSYQDKAAEAQQQYLSQAQSSVESAFSNLADYVQGLGTSDASPLSVQDQYQLANDNFDTDYQAAMGGDYDALTRLQSESQTALSLDQQWLGSGTDYSKAYQDMLTKLQAIGNLGADTFTANLAKQLAAQQVDATLQVNKSIQTMNATLQRLIRMQAIGAKAA
ncbi:phage tail length tape measure family protein [Acetobacter senegalensis]|uniref:phage tail length tape measure family protein n=1 Tax=Acetobacter senegalensis TaxID=446692 RepID=UPI001EDADFA5|nr:phage tail length tape measure family protein [Acetobacter senegalensis]MCG4260763.1 phage tail length tape measure family protein [Acetobacter senegalensis]